MTFVETFVKTFVKAFVKTFVATFVTTFVSTFVSHNFCYSQLSLRPGGDWDQVDDKGMLIKVTPRPSIFMPSRRPPPPGLPCGWEVVTGHQQDFYRQPHRWQITHLMQGLTIKQRNDDNDDVDGGNKNDVKDVPSSSRPVILHPHAHDVNDVLLRLSPAASPSTALWFEMAQFTDKIKAENYQLILIFC
jgi:hypothetical protein